MVVDGMERMNEYLCNLPKADIKQSFTFSMPFSRNVPKP